MPCHLVKAGDSLFVKQRVCSCVLCWERHERREEAEEEEKEKETETNGCALQLLATVTEQNRLRLPATPLSLSTRNLIVHAAIELETTLHSRT